MRADFEFDHDQRGRPGDSALAVVRTIGEAILVVAALAILYLAFRGPSGHPQADTAPAPAGSSSPAAGTPGTGQRASALPASLPAAAATPRSARSSATPAAGPLGAKAQAYLAGRHGQVEAAVLDLSTGQQWTVGQQAPQAEAGVAGLEILEGVLNQRKVQRVVLSLTEQELTPPLIEQGSDSAGTTLWADVGGAAGMRAFGHKAGLAHTSPSDCVQCAGSDAPGWALTTSTPQDQLALLRQLVAPSSMLDSNGQKYALRLLENVTSAQRWGVSAGVPAGVTVALKNGWMALKPGSSPDWQVNSVGWVSGGGRDYLMAVFSSGNPSQQYGIDTIDHLGETAWSALAPAR